MRALTLPAIALAAVLALLALVPGPRFAVAGPAPANGGCISQNQATGAYTNNCAFGLQAYTVATLPVCNAATRLLYVVVTDATAPTYLGTLTGGGTVTAGALCNGTAWVAD